MNEYDMMAMFQTILKYLKAYWDQNEEVMEEEDKDELSDLIEDVSAIVDQNGGEV